MLYLKRKSGSETIKYKMASETSGAAFATVMWQRPNIIFTALALISANNPNVIYEVLITEEYKVFVTDKNRERNIKIMFEEEYNSRDYKYVLIFSLITAGKLKVLKQKPLLIVRRGDLQINAVMFTSPILKISNSLVI